MKRGFFFKVKTVLNTEIINFRKIYYFIIASLTGLDKQIRIKKIENIETKSREKKVFFEKNFKIRELLPQKVAIKQKTLISDLKHNTDPFSFRFNLPNIYSETSLARQIKWKFSKLNINTAVRDYNTTPGRGLRVFETAGVSLKSNGTRQIPACDMELERRLRVTEEIISISPYIKSKNDSFLYSLPIAKVPVSKSYFPENQMAHFREVLAAQAKTDKRNIEITSIFDKFDINLYQSIKQDPKSQKLLCFPTMKKTSANSENMYYLIIGHRRDNKTPVKALAKLP